MARLPVGMRVVMTTLIGAGILAGSVPAAHAVLAGENGRIVLISGRDGGDSVSKAYLLPVPSNTVGGGTLSAPIVPSGGQWRHPTWSPDRTKIAVANGPANVGPFDIFIIDLVAGTLLPLTDTGDNLSDDRPAWSPDGTRLALERQPSVGSSDRHIVVTNDLTPPLNPASVLPLTAAGGTFEGKPAWTPDSSTVYFHRGDPSALAGDSAIYRKSSTGGVGGAETLAVVDSASSEAQPSISPDGNRICYTLTTGGFNDSADVFVANLGAAPASGVEVSKPAAPDKGDYNCTWSPDGQMIAYVNGIFSTGRLVMVRADNGSPSEIVLAEASGFDGNPDWAPDGRPDCPDTAVTTTAGQPVTFSIECTDTGPEYERSNVREYWETQPANGTVEQNSAGDPFTYTPNAGFTGIDTFDANSFDELGFGTDRSKVTITVTAPNTPVDPPGGDDPPVVPPTATCYGRAATITGTDGRDKLKGTRKVDVIVGGDGDDKISGGGRKDFICGGAGNDKLKGGAGKDRLSGEEGDDRLSGGGGVDRLNGGLGSDRCIGGPGRDRASNCEQSSGIP